MMRFRSVLAGMIAVVLTASTVPAQGAPSVTTALPAPEGVEGRATRADTSALGTLESAVVGARAVRIEPDAAAASLAQQGSGFGRAETFMIVGGAAFVAGLLIGDDAGTVVMVGGALMGLYGLYLYLQTQ